MSTKHLEAGFQGGPNIYSTYLSTLLYPIPFSKTYPHSSLWPHTTTSDRHTHSDRNHIPGRLYKDFFNAPYQYEQITKFAKSILWYHE